MDVKTTFLHGDMEEEIFMKQLEGYAMKTQLSSKFNMKDLSASNFILGMEIKRDQKKRKL